MVNRKKQQGRERLKRKMEQERAPVDTPHSVPKKQKLDTTNETHPNQIWTLLSGNPRAAGEMIVQGRLVSMPIPTSESQGLLFCNLVKAIVEELGQGGQNTPHRSRLWYWYGSMLLHGGIVDEKGHIWPISDIQDQAQGISFLEQSGSKDAAWLLSNMYGSDYADIDQDESLQLHWLQKSAKMGHGEAAFGMAMAHLDGRLQDDLQQFKEWLHESSKAGCSNADLFSKLILWVEEDSHARDDGMAVLAAMWSQGLSESVIMYLVMLCSKTNEIIDLTTAFRGFELVYAYTADDWRGETCQHVLVSFYHTYGTILVESSTIDVLAVDKGINCLVKAVSLGNAQAASRLAEAYHGDFGKVEIDNHKYVHWLTKAAQMGQVDSALALVEHYSHEANINLRLARKWTKHAARLGNAQAQTLLHQCSAPNCDELDPTGKEFKRCAKCHAVIYCSIECQRHHWKNGHKKHCIPKDMGHNIRL